MSSEFPPAASRPSGWRRLFVGPLGLRAGWRLLLFHVVAFGLATGAIFLARVARPGLTEGQFTVDKLLLLETIYIASTFVALVVMARIERRRLSDYGIPLRGLFGAPFWRGAAAGVAAIGAIALVVAVGGGMSISGLTNAGDLLSGGVLWLLGALAIAVFEELFFRGYFLSALSDGIGAWPAAVLQALYFGFVLHYLEKDNETLLDGFNVSLIALALCVSVLRSGDIRWATGLHWTFNFTSFFVLGSPNTAFGGPVEPHLLASTFHGPEWLTGGATGLEASVVATVVFALLVVLALRLRPAARATRQAAS